MALVLGACSLTVDLDGLKGGTPQGLGGEGGGGAASPCESAQDCPSPDDTCVSALCVNGECGTIPTPTGTPSGSEEPGDCLRSICDGTGFESTQNDDDDRPVDTSCTVYRCSEGALLPPDHAVVGASCELSSEEGVCDGSGTCRECNAAADCASKLADDFCQRAVCVDGTCQADFTAAGTVHPQQLPGDCMRDVCDGAGQLVAEIDDSDVPDDGNDCTINTCNNGTPEVADAEDGVSCGEGDALACLDGTCTGCATPSQCGADTACLTRTCESGSCGFVSTAAGTSIPNQVQGDCKQLVCDGNGGITSQTNNGDLPNDNNECTFDMCSAGAPLHPPRPVDTTCEGDNVCDGGGACVDCNNPTQCPNPGECLTPICAGHQCGSALVPDGTPTPNQTTGDCKRRVCQMGSAVTEPSNGDLPVDGNPCTLDLCTMGAPSNPPASAGTACSVDGGTVCDGAGRCVECVSHTDCRSDQHCAMNKCRDDLGAGATCSSPLMCTSNFCEDGVCCKTSCGVCQRCDGAGNCKNVANYTDPFGECGTGVCFEGACCGGGLQSTTPMDVGSYAEQPPCPIEP